jgi:UDP:flavonoid glycosyltransferase YjiC (YdhE family)
VRKAGWRAYRAVFNLGRLGTRHWWDPVRQLRREQGLRPECDPLFRDKFSPDLVLALFSPLLAKKQPDWPTQTLQPGFVFFDQHRPDLEFNRKLAEFLAIQDALQDPPIVFTQGSTAVHSPGNFYEVSAEAAGKLGRRALLLGTPNAPGLPSPQIPAPQILALPYAPYSLVFRGAAINVHQGGSGTTGQALSAGRPQLIVPFGWDQPDNAIRVEQLGVGLHLPRSKYSVSTAAAALERLLTEKRFADRATGVAAQIQSEDGLNSACNAIETLLLN